MRISKIMKIKVFHLRIIEIMKFLKFYIRIKQKYRNQIIQRDNRQENHDYSKRSWENLKKNENQNITLASNDIHKILRISCDNFENHENPSSHKIITKILEFHKRIIEIMQLFNANIINIMKFVNLI